jgi:hypothetical protein
MIYSGDVLESIHDTRVNRKLNLYMRSAGESKLPRRTTTTIVKALKMKVVTRGKMILYDVLRK